LIKVFVSSTFKDLVEYRTGVREVLHRMKTDVDAMEYFGSRPDTPEGACAKEIVECDVLVGIYAWRYGWQPDPDGPSITEQEFDAAMQAGKKCLCYVVDQNWPWPPGFIDSGDASSRLERFKAKVGKLVVSTFTTPDDLAKRVAADLGNLIRENKPPAAVSPVTLDWGTLPSEVRKEVMQILRRLPETDSVAHDADRVRFVARPEYFGSLVFDRANADYIPFDQDATDIFRLSSKKSLNQVFEFLQNRIQRDAFRQFVELCQSIQLLDGGGKFSGEFIDAITPPRGRLSAPVRVHLSCTSACNFRCSHCCASSGNPYAGELTTPEVHRFIDELADMGCFHLSLGGGEPLVRSDLPEIIRKANDRGVAVRIATNAAAATEEVVTTLRGLKIDTFKVSMEGASDNVYDAVRGEPGAFQAALRGIANLRTLNVPIELHRVLMRTNVSDLQGLVALTGQLSASKLILEALMPVGRAAAHPELSLTEEETNRLWVEAAAIQQEVKWPIEIPHKAPFATRTKLINNLGCECGNLICHIDPLGNVAPTGMARNRIPAGNLRQKSFREIWNTGEAFAPFRSFCAASRCVVRDAAVAGS
jgi:MoaA/NifB/PqqE/SkfB family radical SAM enzyme